MTKIAVIGGGISGLVLTHRLLELKKEKNADFEIVLFEAGTRLGGVFETEKKDGFILEKGPEAFLSDRPAILDLCERLGLKEELIHTNPKHRNCLVVQKGRLVEWSRGFDPAEQSNSWLFLRGRTEPPRYKLFLSFRNGMEELAQALIHKIPPQIFSLSRRVQEIFFDATKQKWTLTFSSGEKEEVDVVCLTAPAKSSAGMLRKFSTGLSEKLGQISYESVASLNLAYRLEDIENPLQAFGFVVPAPVVGPGPASENLPFMACTFVHRKFEHRAPEGFALLRAFVGGAWGKKCFEKNDYEIKESVHQGLSTLLGIRREPYFSILKRYPDSMVQYRLNHLELVSEIEASLRKINGLFLCGSSYRGVGIPDCIEGAENTAERIYETLLLPPIRKFQRS